jgi:hypothetical protein
MRNRRMVQDCPPQQRTTPLGFVRGGQLLTAYVSVLGERVIASVRTLSGPRLFRARTYTASWGVRSYCAVACTSSVARVLVCLCHANMLVCLCHANTQAQHTLAPTGIHLQGFNSTSSGLVLFVKRVRMCTFLLCTLLSSSLGALLYLRQHVVSKRSSVAALQASANGANGVVPGGTRGGVCTSLFAYFMSVKVVASRLDPDTCTV